MRRRLLVLSLFSSLLPAARAQSSPDAERLRAKANVLLQSGSSADAAEAAGMLDKASEIEARAAATLKTQAEWKKLQEPAPAGWEPFVIQLTPFLSVLTVMLTLVFNSYQTRKESQQKREEAVRQAAADEEKRFNDAIALIQKTENFSPAVAILSTFANGPFAPQARQTAVSLLLSTKSYDNFVTLFNSYVEPVSWENVKQLLDLLRSVSTAVGPILTKAWVNNMTDLSVLTPAEMDNYTLMTQERTFLGTKLATLLTQSRTSPHPLDLTNMGLDAIDLTGADLRGCMAPKTWDCVNLDDTDLRGFVNFQSSWFFNTAWWHARRIDTPFLEYLMARFPYTETQRANSRIAISAADYQRNLTRLRALAEEAGADAAKSGTMPSSM